MLLIEDNVLPAVFFFVPVFVPVPVPAFVHVPVPAVPANFQFVFESSVNAGRSFGVIPGA